MEGWAGVEVVSATYLEHVEVGNVGCWAGVEVVSAMYLNHVLTREWCNMGRLSGL